MGIKEFAGKVCNAVEKTLGEEYRVEVKVVQKNNGIRLHGLLILTEKGNVVPTIYLEPFWEAYEAGTSLAEVVRRLLEIYRTDTPQEQIDMDFFKHFESVRNRICYRLIRGKGNEELLEDIPHIPFLDLEICFFYAYSGTVLGEGAILIHNSHMKLWNTSTKELMRLAQENTPRLYPWQCSPMEEVLREIMSEENDREEMPDEEACTRFLADVPMLVLSNRKRVQGASCILYAGLLEQLAASSQCSFYILPSSIHEVILLSDKGSEEPERLKAMIVEINRTQVAPEEVLSDSLYYFDSLEKTIKIIF